MLATISPVADSYQETMSTLRHVMYVERAKDIVNIVSPNQVRTNPLIGKLREEIRMLKEWLKQKDSLIVEHEKREALLKKVLQRTRAACDERAMRAIADNPGTQEALRKERQKRSGEAAAAADALNHVEQRHQENMKLLVEWHREALTVSRRTSEGNIRKAREENAMCMQQLVSTQKRARAEGRRYAREMEHADKNARSASEEFGLHENELGGTSETAVGQLSVQRAETAEAANGVKVGLNPTVVQRELEAVQNLQPMLASVTMGSSQECHYDEALQVTDGSEQEAHMGLTSPRRDTELDTVGAVGQATAEAVCVYLGEDHGFGGQEKKEVMCLRDSFMNAFPGIGIEAGDRLPIETQQVPSVARFPQEAGPNVKDDMCKRSFTDSHIASAEGEPLQLSANLKPELSTKSGAIPSAPADAEISLFQRRVDTPFSEANAASQDSTGEEVQGPTEVRATTKDDEVNGVKLVVGLKDEPDFYSDPESGLRQDRTCSVSVQGQLLSANKVVEEQDKVTPPLEWEASRSSEPGTTTSRHEDKDRVHASVRLRDMDESLTVTTAEKAVTNETVVETASAIAALSDNDISGLLKELGRRLVGRGSKISAVGEGETTDLDRAVIRLAQTPLEQRANAISASLLQDKLHQDEIHFLLKGLEGSSAKDFRVNEKENSTGNNEARFVPDFKAVQEEAILPMKRKMRKTTLLVEPDIQVAMNERKQPADEVRRHEQDFEATSMERGPRSSAFSSRSDLLLANKEEALLISELKKSRRDEGINVEGLEVETGRQRQVDVVGVSEGSNLSTSDAKEETAQSHAAFRDDYIRKRASQGDAQSVNTASAEEGVKTAEQCLTEREILVVDVGAAGDSLGAQHSHECLNLYESEVDRLEQTPANFERNIWKERVKATAALTALEASHRMMLREIKARHGAEISSLRAMNKCCWGDSFPTDSPPFSVLFDPETQESELMGGLEKKNMGKVTYTHSDEKKIRMFPVEDVSEHISPEQSDFKTVRRTSPAALKRPIMLGDDRIVLSTNGRSVHKLECDAGGTAGTTREPVTEIGDLLPPMVGRPQTEHRIGHDRTSETSRDEENPMVSSPREAREKLLEASHELTGTLSVINIVDGVETVGAPNDGYARTPEAGLATHVLSSKDVTEGGGLAAQDTARDLAISSVPTETMAASAKNNWLQLQAQEEMHGAALNDADQRIHEKMEACLRRAEAAEAVAKETDALYKEALARAEVLEDMMQSSTIPREHELAGLRASIVQLEAFFARQIENTATGSSGPTALLLRQRSADLSALAVCTTRGLESGDAIPLGTGEFAVGGLRGDLSPEQYVGELEKTLVRTTMEAAAARQDHLEADLELNCLTKQLAGLKVVQAQLRERLEDAQMKLHQRSHSTARRWLASAARLARNFARPDWPSMSPLPPRVESETSFVNNRSPHGRSSSKPTSGPNGICSPPPFKRVSSLNSAFDFNTRS